MTAKRIKKTPNKKSKRIYYESEIEVGKKENIFKKNYIYSWILNLLFLLMLLLLFVESYEYSQLHEVQSFYSDELITQHSENTFYAVRPIRTITLGSDFNLQESFSSISIYDESFNLIEEEYASNITFGSSWRGRFYGLIKKTVNFTENNASETRYAWILFELNPDLEEEGEIILHYAPAEWNKEPTKTWS